MNMTDTMDGWAGMVWHNAQRRLVSTRFSKWRKGGLRRIVCFLVGCFERHGFCFLLFALFLNVSYDTPLPWWSGCLCFLRYHLGTNLVTDCMCVIKEGNCNFGFSTKCLNGDVVVEIIHDFPHSA
jgi:hypothetical protein